MMIYSDAKKAEYWDHFTATLPRMPGLTRRRLERAKPALWSDAAFWADIIGRHGGNEYGPQAIAQRCRVTYEHMEGNFWMQVRQTVREVTGK